MRRGGSARSGRWWGWALSATSLRGGGIAGDGRSGLGALAHGVHGGDLDGVRLRGGVAGEVGCGGGSGDGGLDGGAVVDLVAADGRVSACGSSPVDGESG